MSNTFSGRFNLTRSASTPPAGGFTSGTTVSENGQTRSEDSRGNKVEGDNGAMLSLARSIFAAQGVAAPSQSAPSIKAIAGLNAGENGHITIVYTDGTQAEFRPAPQFDFVAV